MQILHHMLLFETIVEKEKWEPTYNTNEEVKKEDE